MANTDFQAKTVSGETVVAATPGEVFDLLADFRRHHEFDGSGTVQRGLDGPPRLSLHARFGMRMRRGIPYTIHNEVVEFEEGRRIGWRHLGHHVWRYELEPAGEGTRIVETFDWSTARTPKLEELMGFPARNARGIDATLRRLETLFP